MVQSLFIGPSKTDGEHDDKLVKTTNLVVVDNSNNNGSGVAGGSRNKETTGGSSGRGRVSGSGSVSGGGGGSINEQKIARSGSGGSDCLFSRSTQELLDLNLDLELRSDLERQTTSYHNNQINSNFNQNNTFSIDSRDQKSYQQFSYSTSQTSSCNKLCCFWLCKNQRNSDFNNSNSNSRWNKQFSRWRFDIPIYLQRFKRMAMKKYYLILFCLILTIVSCLIASLVISRSVGDLDGDDSSTSSSSSSSSRLKIFEEPLEARTIDLVDLIECDKTFALTKYRILVKVPKSSPIYNQQPSFLFVNNDNSNQQASNAATSTASSNQHLTTSSITSSSGTTSSPLSIDDIDFSLDKGGKYYLTTIKESSYSTINKAEQNKQLKNNDEIETIATASSSTELETNNNNNNNNINDDVDVDKRSESNPLSLDIKPVTISNKKDAVTPGIEDFAALLAMTTTGEKRTEALGSVLNENNKLVSDKFIRENDGHQIDPLEQAASSLHFSLNSINNKTLLDCFMIDLEKRYDQKIAIEDKYRLVASTRKVNFKKMMSAIIECRKLTWSSLPNTIKIKSIPGEKPLVTAPSTTSTTFATANLPSSELNLLSTSSSSQLETTSPNSLQLSQPLASLNDNNSNVNSILNVTISPYPKAHDFIGTLLSSWLHYGNYNQKTSSTNADNNKNVLQEQDTNSNILIEQQDLSESKQKSQQSNPQAALLAQEQSQVLNQQKKQASFLNMGISMVNGVIPNTLWCGLGDRAANYSELGAEYKVDACCRAHDHCPIRLRPFTTDYGLVNWSMSTRSHCECDIDFNECLNSINSTLSNVIKVLYFRFVGLQCIDIESRQNGESLINNEMTPFIDSMSATTASTI